MYSFFASVIIKNFFTLLLAYSKQGGNNYEKNRMYIKMNKLRKVIRTFFANAVCGTIPGKKRRDIVRIKIKYREYLRMCKKFALEHSGGGAHKIRIDVGARSHNLILLVDKLYAFKFPLHENGHDKTVREKRIVDAFTKISPIKIPKMDVFQWGNITVRRYEFANGVLLKKVNKTKVIKYRDKIASQLANFMFIIGQSDPQEICDLKQKKSEKPSFMFGWFHNDIAENFTVDPNTMDILYFIDWEDTEFVNFKLGLLYTRRNWEKYGFTGLMDVLVDKYTKLYKKNIKQS